MFQIIGSIAIDKGEPEPGLFEQYEEAGNLSYFLNMMEDIAWV